MQMWDQLSKNEKIAQVAELYHDWINKHNGPEDQQRCLNVSLDELVEVLIIKYDLDDNESTREMLMTLAKSIVDRTDGGGR